MSKQIIFEIDVHTGEMTVDIAGVIGPGCEDIQKIIDEVAGAPETKERKPSYYHRVDTRQRVGGK